MSPLHTAQEQALRQCAVTQRGSTSMYTCLYSDIYVPYHNQANYSPLKDGFRPWYPDHISLLKLNI